MECLETRTLLAATLNGLADGRLIYSGAGVANNLTINFDGTNYSFNDTGETITLLGTVAAIGAGSGTNTVTFNPASLAAFTQINVNGGLGNDTVTVTGFRGGQEGLIVQNNAGDGTDTLNINTNLGSAGSRLQGQAQLLAETLNLGGDVFTNNQTINLGGVSQAVNVTGTSTVHANTGTVGSTSTINGANALTIQGGSVQLTGIIGGTTPLTNVSLTSTGAGAMQVPATTVTGDISITAGAGGTNLRGNLTAGDDITITSASTTLTVAPVTLATGGAAGNDITVTGAISGTQSLGLNAAAAGNVTVSGNIALTGTAALVASGNLIDFNGSTAAAGGVTLTAPTITATALQSSGGSVNVTGNTTFDGVGNVTILANTAGAISFSGSLTGNGSNLNLQQANTVSVGGAVTNVNQFTIAKGIPGTIATATINSVTAGGIAVTATGINNRGDLVAVSGAVSLTGAVTLDGADTTNTIFSNGHNVTITGAVNDGTAGTHTLELIANGSGAVQTNAGGIGLTTRLHSLTAAGGTVNLNGVGVVNHVSVFGGVVNFNAGAASVTSSSGSGIMLFQPATVGGTLEVYNVATAPPSANMTVDTTDLAALSGFNRVNFSGGAGGTVHVVSDGLPGTSLSLTTPVTQFGGSVVTVNEGLTFTGGAASVTFFVDTTLNLNSTITGSGTVNIAKLTAGTLTVNGNIGSAGWAANPLNVFGGAGVETVHFAGEVGGVMTSFTSTDVDNITKAGASAITAQGNITINGNFSGAGLQSTTGDILVTGNVSSSGALTFLIPAGQDLQINGTTNAAGNIIVRGRGGALNAASFLGNVTTTGSFGIDSSGANTAALVNLAGSVSASSMVVRGTQINLSDDLTATAGSVHLLGNVDLFGNVVMTSSGLATHFVRVDGTINGAFDLTSNSGLGQTHFVGVIGGVTPLANLTVNAGGYNYIYQNITVTGTVDWQSGDTANAGGDVINVLAGRTITAGTAIILEADSVIVNAVTQLFAPIETVINNGAP